MPVVIVAALTDAMQVVAANEPSGRFGDVVAAYGQVRSGHRRGCARAAWRSGTDHVPGGVAAPDCQVHANVAGVAAGGGWLPAGVPEAGRGEFAATLRRDTDGLIAITATA